MGTHSIYLTLHVYGKRFLLLFQSKYLKPNKNVQLRKITIFKLKTI